MLIEIAPDFSRPLDLLAACHERILKQCDTIERLLHHLASHGCDDSARQAAAGIMRYFDQAAPLHHDDEERNLLPMLELNASASDMGLDLCDFVEVITAEHDEADLLWRRLRCDLSALAEGRTGNVHAEIAQRFIALERHHVAFENERLMPLAQAHLTAEDQERLGRAMAARRGIEYPPT